MKTNGRGQILPVVMICLVILSMIIAAMVSWIQNDSKTATNQQKNSSAVNIAEAGIDRATWKLQSATSTWSTAAAGTVIPGYNFDTTYTDVPGGSYRIKFTAGAPNSGVPTVIITAEGRDALNKETRALQSIVENQTIYSAMMSGGNITWAKGLVVFWGPIMSQGNILLADDVVGSMYYPRKFAKGVVTGPPSGLYPRDINGLQPPNTDNIEWWSEYSGVPSVPVLDFATLRSSAAATGTLNLFGCKNSTNHGINNTLLGAGPWDLRGSCGTNATPHAQHFGNSTNYIVANGLIPNKDYVWYWDSDVTLTGEFCGSYPCSPGRSTGLRGTIVVRGNLTIDTPGDLKYIGHVPANAWMEQQKLLINTFDTAAANEYPADLGLHQSTGVFNFGVDTFNVPGLGGGPYYSTVGIKGFTYVGGNLNIISYMDFNGAVWVNQAVTASNGSISNSCGIYYDDTLQVPALNVILLRLSWREVAASNTPWP